MPKILITERQNEPKRIGAIRTKQVVSSAEMKRVSVVECVYGVCRLRCCVRRKLHENNKAYCVYPLTIVTYVSARVMAHNGLPLGLCSRPRSIYPR